MTPGHYKETSRALANSMYSVLGEPSVRSKPAGGTGYTPSGNGRGGYGMGMADAGYDKKKASTYGRGWGGSAGTEGKSKSKYT